MNLGRVTHVTGMKDVFDTSDTAGQGIIKASEFDQILRLLSLNPLESGIQRITKKIAPQSNYCRNMRIKSISKRFFFSVDLDQMKLPQYVTAFLSVPNAVTDILSVFQVFDPDKRGVIEGDEIMKSLTNVGEPLNEVEAEAFRDNLITNDLGLFD